VTINDNVVDSPAKDYTLAGRAVAVTVGLLMLTAAGFEDVTRPYEISQLVMGSILIGTGSLAPHIERILTRRRGLVPPPVAPDDPSDEYAYLAYLEAKLLDVLAEVEEHEQRIDTILSGLESSAGGVALTARRLRRGLTGNGHIIARR
jgi:hypothetical protein